MAGMYLKIFVPPWVISNSGQKIIRRILITKPCKTRSKPRLKGIKTNLIPPASHFYRNPAHLSYQYDIRRLQQISNDNQTKRGRLLNSIEQGYIYEDIIEWTNWGL